jgi:RHS repeat-associated protein
LQERDASNLPLVTYTRGLDLSGSLEGAGGIGGLLARSANSYLLTSDSSAAQAFYHADGNGNVTCLLNSTQQVMARYLYGPFGDTLSAFGLLAEANLYRFSSKQYHIQSGLTYYGRRYYEPSLHRWLNADPLGERGEINLYRFLENAPTRNIDAHGLILTYLPKDTWRHWEWECYGHCGPGYWNDAFNGYGMEPFDYGSQQSGSQTPGDAMRQVPIIGKLLGPAIDILDSAFRLAGGLLLFSSTLLGQGVSLAVHGTIGSDGVIASAWNSPNNVAGDIVGLAGMALNGKAPLNYDGKRAYLNNPIVSAFGAYATTIGDNIIYGLRVDPAMPIHNGRGPSLQYTVSLQYHEESHVPQARVMGPLYLPWMAIEQIGLLRAFEHFADDVAYQREHGFPLPTR